MSGSDATESATGVIVSATSVPEPVVDNPGLLAAGSRSPVFQLIGTVSAAGAVCGIDGVCVVPDDEDFSTTGAAD